MSVVLRKSAPTILIASNDGAFQTQLASHLLALDLIVTDAKTAAEAITILQELDDISLVVVDEEMPPVTDDIPLSIWLLNHLPGIAIALVASHDPGLTASIPSHCITRFARTDDLRAVAIHIAGILQWTSGA